MHFVVDAQLPPAVAVWLRSRGHRAGPTVIWLRRGNTGKAALVAWLEAHWAVIETALERGERLIEVR